MAKKKTKKRKKSSAKLTVKKFRGFDKGSLYNHIKRIIWAKHKADFEHYGEFISNRKDEDGLPIPKSSTPVLVMSEVRRIDNFTEEDILRIYEYHKDESNEGDSSISEKILPFWEVGFKDSHKSVSRLREYFDGITPNITIIAPKIINKVAQFNAASYIDDDYYTHFQQWVTYCNQYAEDHNLDSDNTIHFTFTEPYQAQNRDMRWEVELFPCSPNGTMETYDFEPEFPDTSLMHTIRIFPETGEIVEEGLEFETENEIPQQSLALEQEKTKQLQSQIVIEKEITAQKLHDRFIAEARAKEAKSKTVIELIKAGLKGKDLMDAIKAL